MFACSLRLAARFVNARAAFARSRLGDADIEGVVQETLLAIPLKRQIWDLAQRLALWLGTMEAALHRALKLLAAAWKAAQG